MRKLIDRQNVVTGIVLAISLSLIYGSVSLYSSLSNLAPRIEHIEEEHSRLDKALSELTDSVASNSRQLIKIVTILEERLPARE